MFEFLAKKTLPGTQLISGSFLLDSKHSERVTTIFKLSRVSDSSFKLLYRPALESLAEHVQLLPGSEFHHHAYPGGLLTHILDVVIYALRERSGLQLPTGESPEVIRTKADIYTYAVFVAAIAHDVAKPVVDIEVMLYDNKGRELGHWNSFDGPMSATNACSYTFRYRKGRKYQLHNLAASILLTRIVPSEGIQWIASDVDLFYDVLQFINGNDDESCDIGSIVKQADQTSVSLSLGADNVLQKGSATSKIPLPEKIKRAMKVVAADPATTFNSQGALGWFDGEHCWVMSKRFVDDLRAQLELEGHSGIPNNNSRLFDVLVESGIILPNNGKAIWKVAIEIGDWKPGVFTLLKVKKSFLWTENNEIPKFDGIIRLELSEDKNKPDDVKGEIVNPQQPVDADDVLRELIEVKDHSAKTQQKPSNDNPDNNTKNNDYSSLFLVDADKQTDDSDKAPGSPDIQDGRSVPNFSGEPDSGTNFLFWLRHGIQSKEIRYNGSEYFVHMIKEGVFLVSPKIFKVYGETKKENWSKVQSSFQKLRINIKNAKGENWHSVRIQGDRSITTMKGWLIPYDEIFEGKKRPLLNKHLTLLDV